MRIGIIGAGGAGLCAAWLLEESHDVVVWERGSVPGGHARSTRLEVDGEVAYASPGFNWFSKQMYPRFLRLLELVEQPTVKIPMTLSFTDRRDDWTLAMPPVGLRQVGRLLTRPRDLATLLRLKRAVGRAAPYVHDRELTTTMRRFIDALPQQQRFKDEFLEPLLSGAWGCPWERTPDCAIYPLMKYVVLHAPHAFRYFWWYVCEDGAGGYGQRMADSLHRADLRLSAKVTGIEKRPEGGFEVRADGVTESVDALVIATGARDAARLLQDTAGVDPQRRALADFEYYLAYVATHRDPGYMPARREEWCVTNIAWDGEGADLTVWSGFRPPGDSRRHVDLFTSYVRKGEEPAGLLDMSAFWLPLETPRHFEAQAALAALQGEGDLHFAGDYTCDVGSHEDAIVSAIEVTRRLNPDSWRLSRLLQPSTAMVPGTRAPLAD